MPGPRRISSAAAVPVALFGAMMATAGSTKVCSMPFLVEGVKTWLECEGPGVVNEARDALLSQVNGSEVTCMREDDACARAVGQSGSAWAVLEACASVARWPTWWPASPRDSCNKGLTRCGATVLIASASNRLDLANLTWTTWADYASFRGYSFLPIHLTELGNRSAHWIKIWLLYELARRLEEIYSVVVVVDDDIMVTNPGAVALEDSFAVDDILVAVSDPLLYGVDHVERVQFNSGIIGARRPSRRVAALLEAAWLEPLARRACWLKNCPFWDQSALVALVDAGHPFLTLPYRSLQSFWNSHVCALDWIDPQCDLRLRGLAWRPTDFAAHVSGGSLESRIKRVNLLLSDDIKLSYGYKVDIDFAAHRQILIDIVLEAKGCEMVSLRSLENLNSLAVLCSAVHIVQDVHVQRLSLSEPLLLPTADLEALAISTYNSPEVAARAYERRVTELVRANLLELKPTPP